MPDINEGNTRPPKDSGSSKRDAAEQFLHRVTDNINLQTDPELIKKILINTGLNSLSVRDQNITNFINKLVNKPVDVSLLADHIKSNLLSNWPICNFLAYIQENNLISDEELMAAKETIQLQMNLLCLLEAFTLTMANSDTFNEDIYQFITAKRNTFAPGNPIVNLFFTSAPHATLFKRLKMVSVDPAMTAGAFNRLIGENKDANQQESKKFIKRHALRLWNKKDVKSEEPDILRKDSVKNIAINILEAAMEDATHSHLNRWRQDNAKAGTALIAMMEDNYYLNKLVVIQSILPLGTKLLADARYSLLPDLKVGQQLKKSNQFLTEKEWVDLYQSWNLCFVVSNLDSVFLPLKLLVPSVSGAEPKNYMEVRVFLLFLMGNIFFLENTSDRPLFAKKFAFKNAEKLFLVWSEINKTYATTLLKTHCTDNMGSVDDVFNEVFGNHKITSTILHLKDIIMDYDNFHITKYAKNASSAEQEEKSTSMFFGAG